MSRREGRQSRGRETAELSEERRGVREGGDTFFHLSEEEGTKPFHLGTNWELAVCIDTRGISMRPPKMGPVSRSSQPHRGMVRIW